MAAVMFDSICIDVELIVFDKDGTLIDFHHLWSQRAELGVDALIAQIDGNDTLRSNIYKALGYDADLGSIEAGKLADLVILDANVLDDIFQSDKVNMVMLNGRLYDAATLNEKVTGDRVTKPFYWQ